MTGRCRYFELELSAIQISYTIDAGLPGYIWGVCFCIGTTPLFIAGQQTCSKSIPVIGCYCRAWRGPTILRLVLKPCCFLILRSIKIKNICFLLVISRKLNLIDSRPPRIWPWQRPRLPLRSPTLVYLSILSIVSQSHLCCPCVLMLSFQSYGFKRPLQRQNKPYPVAHWEKER